MARRGQALAVPLITAALAVSALAGGWALFRQGSPRVTTPPDTVSQIYVLTDDPGARIEIGLQLTLNFGEIYDVGEPPPLDLDVHVTPSRDTPVRWAVVLTDDARLPWPTGEPAGKPLRRGDQRGFGDVWVDGDVQDAWFVRNAGGSPFRSPSMGGSVVFGTSRPVAKGESFLVEVVAPTDGPFVVDSGESYSLYLPSLGVPSGGPAAEPAEALATLRREPMPVFVGEADLDRVPGALRAELEATAWWFPVGYTLTAHADGHRFEDRLVQARPPPAGPTTWRWSGTDRLFIQAFARDRAGRPVPSGCSSWPACSPASAAGS